MRYLKILNIILVITLFMVGCILSKGNVVEPKSQTTCPVMGGKINKQVYTYYEGKRINFCCKGCIGEFYKEPEKYIKQLEDEGVTLEETSKTVNKNGSSQGINEGSGKHRASGSCGGGCSGCSR